MQLNCAAAVCLTFNVHNGFFFYIFFSCPVWISDPYIPKNGILMLTLLTMFLSFVTSPNQRDSLYAFDARNNLWGNKR